MYLASATEEQGNEQALKRDDEEKYHTKEIRLYRTWVEDMITQK